MASFGPNHHCSVVQIDGAGVMIEGASGSGKTSLALGLIDTARARGLAASLVSDDQALLSVAGERLVASAPAAIAGLAELRGYGIARVEHVDCCEIDVVGRLDADEGLPRMAEPGRTTIKGVELPLLHLPGRHEQQAARIVLAWLADRGPATGAQKKKAR